MIEFQWDKEEATFNRQTHGISFVEAKSIFFDENARIIPDPEYPREEERFILIGLSVTVRQIVVCRCFKEGENMIRLLSARKATSCESEQYWRVPVIQNNYDFSKAKRNPYVKPLKKTITLKLDEETVSYFKSLSEDNGIPYQTLINLFLRDCAQRHKKPNMDWF